MAESERQAAEAAEDGTGSSAAEAGSTHNKVAAPKITAARCAKGLIMDKTSLAKSIGFHMNDRGVHIMVIGN